MRTMLIAVTACLLFGTLGNSNAHDALPLNALTNAGFEDGLAEWGIRGTGHLGGVGLIAPGAEGTATAVLVNEVGAGSAWLHQDTAPLAAFPVTLLDFSAKIVANLENPMPQGIRVLSGHHPATGQAEFTALVDFAAGSGKFMVFCNGLTGSCPRTDFVPPADAEWHHYQVLLFQATGFGALFIDGDLAATSIGDPASVNPPTRTLFGDVAYHRSGAAPNVAWDEIYYGPVP